MRTTTLVGQIGWTAVGVLSALAQGNLVVNGGFESGFSGWLGTYGYLSAPDVALEGESVGVIIDVSSSSSSQPLQQSITTVPGAAYNFSFGLLSGSGRVGIPSGGSALVRVRWGNRVLGVFTNPSTTEWQLHQFEVTATADSTTIAFWDQADMRWQLVDDVRVVPVPEASPLCLLLMGSCGLVLGVEEYQRLRRCKTPKARVESS